MSWSMSCVASRRVTNCRSRRAPRKSSSAPCRAGSDMELLSIAAILLGFLVLLLGAGVWIAVALMATGWAGMQFAGGGIPGRQRACDNGVGQQRVVVARGLAALHLDGRNSLPHAVVG